MSSTQISRWLAEGYLHRVLPGVYAVGHTAPSFEADLAAAILYAGPGSGLSHASASWWCGLSERRPITIDVTTPRRCCSQPGVRVHDRRIRTLEWERGLPTTTVIDTLLDVAAAEDTGLDQVRYLLSQADYHHLVDLGELNAVGRRGRPGGALLRSALHRHLPQLARTRSPLEIDWLLLCERHDLPLPETNVPLLGFTVDAMWREQRVVVEVDGEDGHAGPARLESDRRRDLRLRSGGFIVLRYAWSQVHDDEDEVAADIRAALLSRTARSA